VKGLLITLEGIDGSGKSTAIRHIAAKLKELVPERTLLITAEPTNSAAGRILRSEILRESTGELSFAEHMEELFLFMPACESSRPPGAKTPAARTSLSPNES